MITQQHHILHAQEKGLEVVGRSGNNSYLIYRFIDCGHTQKIAKSSVKDYHPKCAVCTEERYANEALEMGLELISSSSVARYRAYKFKSCGHYCDLKVAHVRSGSFKCGDCIIEKFNTEAKRVNLSLIGKSSSPHYRKYRFNECGHNQDIKISAVRKGVFECSICKDNYWQRPSNIYLLYMQSSDGTQWMKLGYSNNLKQRVKGYGLDRETYVRVLFSVPMPSGKLAHSLEQLMHNKFKKYNLNSDAMKHHHSESGFSECYAFSNNLERRMLTMIKDSI